MLLTTCAPPARLKVFAFSETLPALPAPDSLNDVSTDIFPPSAIVNVGTGVEPGAATVICPAFPVLDAVLNSPLPVPEMDTSSLAVNSSVPPAPAPLVLLSTRDPPPVWVKLLTLSEMLPALPILEVLLRTCAPPARLRVFAFSRMLPALPAPDVATDIVPPSAIVNVGTGANAGADTVICPAFPLLAAVLNNPLPAPEIETNSPAVNASVPPAPSPVVLLLICAPPARASLFTLIEILPAAPAPSVATEIFPH